VYKETKMSGCETSIFYFLLYSLEILLKKIIFIIFLNQTIFLLQKFQNSSKCYEISECS